MKHLNQQKNHIKWSLKNALLMILFIGVSSTVFSVNPPKIRKQKMVYNNLGDVPPVSGPYIETEDWLFATIEDKEDKGIVSAGFTDGPHGSSSGTKKPSIIKTDANLNELWRYHISSTTTIYDASGNTYLPSLSGSSRCSDIIQAGDYYYATVQLAVYQTFGLGTSFNERPVLIKLGKDGTLQTGFPMVLSTSWGGYTNDLKNRVFGISYDATNNCIYLCGTFDVHVWAAKVNESNYSIVQTNFSQTEGAYNSIAVLYADGSVTGELPETLNQAPYQVCMVGRFNSLTTPGSFSCTNPPTGLSDAVVTRCDLDFANPVNLTLNAPTSSSDYSSSYPRGHGGVSTCPTLTVYRSSNDEAFSVEQMKDGNLIVSIRYNISYIGGFSFFNGNGKAIEGNIQSYDNCLCAEAKTAGREQLIDADGFALIITKGFSSNTTITTPDVKRHQHVGHLNGDDYQFVLHPDNDGEKILGSSTTADFFFGDNWSWEYRNRYRIFSYDPQLSSSTSLTGGVVEWIIVANGTGQSYACIFDIYPTYRGGAVGVGNSYLGGENYDWILLGRPCETNITLSGNDLGPNTLNRTFSIEKFIKDDPNYDGVQTEAFLYNPRLINAQVIVETGFSLRIHGTCTLSFASNENQFDSANNSGREASIVVKPGAKIIMESGAKLTGYSGCPNTMWGGVKLEGGTSGTNNSVQSGGEIEMNEALIENAVVGIRALTGAKVKCYNTPPIIGRTSIINFRNCRRAIEIHPWTANESDNVFFKYVNFLGDAPLYDYNYKGIKDFVSTWDFNGLKIWGCSFINSYTGTYYDDSRGTAITSFNLTADIIKGSNITTNNGSCSYPSGCTNLFDGLDVGIWNGGNSVGNVIKVYGNEFKNIANGVYGGTGFNLRLYDNDFYWNTSFLQPPSTHGNNWVKAIHTVNYDGLILDKNRINAKTFLYPYTSMFMETVTSQTFPSIVQNNITWNDLTLGAFGVGMFNGSSGTNLDFFCNEYNYLAQDWYLGGSFRPAVGSLGAYGNANKWTKNLNLAPDQSIFKATSPTLDYFTTNPANFNDPYNPNRLLNVSFVNQQDHLSTERDCPQTNPCDRYNYEEEFGGEHSGEFRVIMNSFQESLEAMNKGDFELSRSKVALIERLEENNKKILLINTLIPIFEQKRQFNMTVAEKNILLELSVGHDHENEYARNVLTFFADIQFMPYTPPKPQLSSNIDVLAVEDKPAVSNFSIFPNPNSGLLYFSLPKELKNTIEINVSNMMGLIVLNTKIMDQTDGAMDISGLTSGVYLVSIMKNGQLLYKSLISKL